MSIDKGDEVNKKIIQSLITLVLLGTVVFVFYDFYDKQKNNVNLGETHNENGIQYGADIGNAVYNYELTDLITGETVNISDYKGKKLLLVFWASWCPYCKALMPELQQLTESQDEIVVLGINAKDLEANNKDPLKFIEDSKVTFTNVISSDEMLNTFQIQSVPTLVFVNSSGIIEAGVLGGLTKDVIESKFKEID